MPILFLWAWGFFREDDDRRVVSNAAGMVGFRGILLKSVDGELPFMSETRAPQRSHLRLSNVFP